MLLPCENDQAKLDHFSRLACSTNLSKILESGPPERRPFWIEAQAFAKVSSNLLRSPISVYKGSYRHFCANLLKLPHIDLQVNVNFLPGSLFVNRLIMGTTQPGNLRFAQRKISKSDQRKITRADRARRRSSPGSCNGLFSLGIPYSGSRGSCLT
jgi:hypothetical protein